MSDKQPLTFDEYQERAMKTAIYPREHAVAYPALGLVGEAGEVCEKIKKALRDHGGEINQEELMLELSDVLWYLAALASDFDLKLHDVAKTETFAEYNTREVYLYRPDEPASTASDLVFSALLLAQSVGEIQDAVLDFQLGQVDGCFDEKDNRLQLLRRVLYPIAVLAMEFYCDLETIARANLDKLADRAERGVIGGEGDTR